MAIALDIIKKKSWLDDTLAQQALDIKNAQGNEAFKEFVAKNKPVQAQPVAWVPPAPVTPPNPVTPPTTPTAPQVTWVDGQKFAQAPVDPTTGLSKPLEPTVTPTAPTVTPEPIKAPEPVKTEVSTAKTEPVVDYTQAKWREQDITTNLESFKAQWMTPEQILKASDYANASPEKRAMIEPYLKQTQPTNDSMFNSIVSKVDVLDAQKVLPSYKIAQNRYLKANMYASMTPAQVTKEMNASRLIEWSRTWEDLKTLNPKLAQDAQNLRIVNGSKSNIFTPVNNPDGTPVKDENGKPVVENNLVKTFTQDYLDDYGDFLREVYKPETMDEINAKIYTPDVIDAQNKATEVELELVALEKDINSINSDIEKETAWSGATWSRKRLEKSIRAETLQNEYNSALKKYQVYANKANNLITQNTAVYQEAYKQNQALQSALVSAWSKKYENELALSQSQAEFDQKLAQQTQLASDPTTAIGWVLDQFAQLWIIADRDLSWHLAEQKRLGMSVPEYTQKMIADFKNKPQYKAMMDAQMRSLAPATTQDWTKLDETTLYNQKTGETKKVSASIASGYPASFSGDTTAYIASKEWFRDTAYQDSAWVWTIWYGTTWINGKPIQPWQTITQADAQRLLQEDIAKHSNWKNFIDEATLSPSQRTALASFEYNLWPWIWNKSAMNIIDMIKSGDLEWAGREIQKYNQAGGKVIKWLQNRRAEEAQLLMNTGVQGTGTSQVEKDATLERIRRWQVTDSDLGKIQQKAIAWWWWEEFTEALKKWMKTTLTDTQIKWLATVDDKIQKDTVLDNVNLVSQQKETIKSLLNTDINANWFNDIALINAFQKIVDPGVAVKEWDVALLQSGIALSDKLNPSNLLSKVSAGTKLTPETRKQMLDATVAIYNAQADFGNDLLKKKYYKLAENYWIDLDDYWYSYDKLGANWNVIDVKAKSALMEQLDRIQKWFTDTLSSIQKR